MDLLAGGGGQCRERRVERRPPDEHGARLVQEHQVVVDRGPRGGRGVDADIARCPGAVDPVVDADVVREEPARRRALEVDAGRHVPVDAVADDLLARGLVVVDPVVPIVVRHVVDYQIVRGTRVELQTRVLVVMGNIVRDEVPNGPHVDARGRPRVLSGVGESLVADDLGARGSVHQVDAGFGVVVQHAPTHHRIRVTGQPNSSGHKTLHRPSRVADVVVRQCDVRGVRDVDSVARCLTDRDVLDHDPGFRGNGEPVCATHHAHGRSRSGLEQNR